MLAYVKLCIGAHRKDKKTTKTLIITKNTKYPDLLRHFIPRHSVPFTFGTVKQEVCMTVLSNYCPLFSQGEES